MGRAQYRTRPAATGGLILPRTRPLAIGYLRIDLCENVAAAEEALRALTARHDWLLVYTVRTTAETVAAERPVEHLRRIHDAFAGDVVVTPNMRHVGGRAAVDALCDMCGVATAQPERVYPYSRLPVPAGFPKVGHRRISWGSA